MTEEPLFYLDLILEVSENETPAVLDFAGGNTAEQSGAPAGHVPYSLILQHGANA